MGAATTGGGGAAVITGPEQVTPAWLNGVLLREGVLGRGAVSAVDTATAPHLAVRYTPDAAVSAPTRLFLKLQRRRNIAGGNGRPEVRAYRAWMGQRTTLPMLPRCFDAAYDEDAAISHLLLDDFSATHTLPKWPVPSADHRLGVTGCSARFHARWWQHPDNGQFGTLDPNLELDCGDEAGYADYARRYQDAFAAFAELAGDRLSPDDRALYAAIVAALPALWSRHIAPRFASGEHLTLIQGDSHWGQFACPNDPTRDTTIMFDLECLHVGLPAADLAYRLPFSWTTEQRRALEPAVVAHYLAELSRYGVRGYDHARFWHDYRLAFIFVALYPLKPFTERLRADTLRDWDGAAPEWFWRDIALITANFRDLKCAELL